jgi:hypothetical protein
MLWVGISLVNIAEVLVQYIVIGPMFVHAYVPLRQLADLVFCMHCTCYDRFELDFIIVSYKLAKLWI